MSALAVTAGDVRGRLVKILFDDQRKPRVAVIIGIVVVGILWTCAVFVAASVDQTLRLPAPGRGFLDHYGFQTCLLAGPLVLLTAYYAVSYFLQILRGIGDLLGPSADLSVVRSITQPHIDSLLLRDQWRNMLWLFMFIGATISIADFRQLNSPAAYWGNDVFNAMAYRHSFVVANAFLLWLWAFVYPVGVFYALHLTISTEMIVAKLRKRHLLKLDFLHVDNCGGMAKFGTLNLLVMLIYLWPCCAAYALHMTHRYTYLSLVFGGIAASAGFVIQSIYGVYWVSRSIKSEREQAIAELNDRIGSAMDGQRRNFTAALAAMQYRDRVLSVAAFPYSGSVAAAVNLLRYAPTAIAFAHLLWGVKGV